MRDQVQELCTAAAQSNARLLSLAVPTGGGTTLAAIRFALERARRRPKDVRRVIVVLPYPSIIEQNAKVYRKVFGDTHFSNTTQERCKHSPRAGKMRNNTLFRNRKRLVGKGSGDGL